MEHLEAKVRNQVADIFKDESFVKCSYIGKNIVRGFEAYINHLGLGQNPISASLFNGDILSYLVTDGPLAEDSISHGIYIITEAVRERFGVDPVKISKEVLADIGHEIVQMHADLSLLVHKLVMQKNYQTLATATASNQPETGLNINLGVKERELKLVVFAEGGDDLRLYLNRN